MKKQQKVQATKKQPARLNKKSKKQFFLTTCKVLFVLIFWAAFIFLMALVYYAHDLPDITIIAQQDKKPQIVIHSTDGSILARYGDLRGDTLTYSQIPTHLLQAIVTAEDRRYFNHFGLDILGIIRAYYSNLKAGKVVQGGSTLTQQLAKIIYLTPERSLKRKIQEAMIAIQLERHFSKEQIISMYVNRVYMGKGNYGMDGAAEFYFGKKIEDLTVFECAFLAAMVQAPSKYSQASNIKTVIDRAHYILREMAEEGYITEQESRQAVPPRLIERGAARGILKNPYFTDYIISQIPDLIENPNQDLNIYTTLDLKAQSTLEQAAAKVMAENSEKHNVSQIAAISMEPNGAIKAMLGGRSYDSSQFNRAVSAKRQPGSAFKMFVYTAALENGYTPDNIFDDKPVSYKQGKGLPIWTPKNFTNRFLGEMKLSYAFSHSINTVTVQLSEEMGRTKSIKMAERMGVKATMPNLPSIALGVSEVTLLEMTQALAHIANNGTKVEAFSILQIRNFKNEIIYEHSELPTEQVLSLGITNEIKNMMVNVVEEGTGKAAHLPHRLAYGKTGTTQEHKDAWFIGATDALVTGVWVGNDDNTPMKKVSGGNLPTYVWKAFMENAGEIKRTQIPQASLPWKNNGVFDILFSRPSASDENSEEDE